MSQSREDLHRVNMNVFSVIVLCCVIIYLLSKYFFNYWKRLGFDQMEPKFFFGNIGDLFLLRKSFPNSFIDFYEQFKHHKFIGGYFMYKPILFIHDPELVKDILVTNFSSFSDRPRHVDEKKDPISAHLFNIGGQKWRDWRSKLSPVFSSGKLKSMFPIMRDCGRDFQNFITKNLNDGTVVFNFNDLFARYTTHNIITIIFSIESDCFDDPNNIFRKMSAKFTESSTRRHFMDIFSFLIPNIHQALSIFQVKMVTPEVNDFMLNIVKKVVKHREETSCERNDFMQLLMQLKTTGLVSKKNGDANKNSGQGQKITIDELAAQVFVFFVGGEFSLVFLYKFNLNSFTGFETSTATMSFCLFELCKNPEIQYKIQEELDRELGDNFDVVTYESINSLKYLESCIDETLRLYPPLSILFRRCTRDYKIPNTDLFVEKGTSVFIPTIAMQRDANIYDNPLQFKPERFLDSPNGNGNANGIFYLPFGDGPRKFMRIDSMDCNNFFNHRALHW